MIKKFFKKLLNIQTEEHGKCYFGDIYLPNRYTVISDQELIKVGFTRLPRLYHYFSPTSEHDKNNGYIVQYNFIFKKYRVSYFEKDMVEKTIQYCATMEELECLHINFVGVDFKGQKRVLEATSELY